MKKLLLFLFTIVSMAVNAQFEMSPNIDPVNPTFSTVTTNTATIGTGTVATNTSTMGVLRIKQDNSWIDFGGTGTNNSFIHFNQTPNNTNYGIYGTSTASYLNGSSNSGLRVGGSNILLANSSGAALTGTFSATGPVSTNTINGTGSNMYINGATQINLQVAGSDKIQIGYSNFIFSPTAGANSNKPFLFTTPAHYSITAGQNTPAFQITGATRGWQTGNIATQYENYFSASTYTAASSSTITTAFGLYVEAPIMSTGMSAQVVYGIGSNGSIFSGGNIWSSSVIYARSLKCNSSAVTTTTGSAVGTGGTSSVTANSTNAAGLITITTGTTSVGTSAPLAIVTFANAYSVAPNVILSPANQNAVQAASSMPFISNVSATAFTISAGSSSITTSTALKYYYMVME